ncbi:MAG: phosphoribosylformylglycinamidine synthase subunit PurL [Acidobacteriota bacterium]|nr:phosphoribosylformylglycinamidine synthase subunit PurL [Acidobacteriota bacterium]MDQ3417611.1 phosphoribosylformylglycinamidine synthase subunit PurL [Acidobacteriota bacterium]
MSTVDAAVLERHGLKGDEYARIVAALGREPSLTELGIFSVMWSEHCSYKSSRVHLRTLPTQGPRVLQGPGENAGAVDIGDGLAAVFKIESHNHPSFIEPYQGAATGVGGIIRDIFTMGARPVALMNSLRFGPMDGEHGARTRRIVEGVVAGIAGYGNSIGIPTVGGEIVFDEPYAGNPLVNVFCLGLAGADALVMGRAEGVGNPVYYVGAKTGRDGIHGATMASAEFDDKSAEKRPAVQVGDPFMEKLLLEACLELMKGDALIGVQDMGAAGLTCATSEMGARSGSGIEIDVMHVPQRESGMSAYEIMLSESQERMLLVVKKGREPEVEEIFEKWDLHAAHIGFVTNDGLLRVKDHGKVVAEIPNTALVVEAPVYTRPMTRPAYLDDVQQLDVASLSQVQPQDTFFRLLASPTIASKRWVYRQYDHMVRTNSIVLAGMGAAVVRVKGTARALAMSVDGNGRYCYLDPFRGAMLAVAEAARNVACAGAQPIGATNCLNFGNPERPEIMWQFGEAVRGIGEACRALDVPITGGNVSLYNETDGNAIYPTPVLGVVGLIEDASCAITRAFRAAGDNVILLGETFDELGGSEYLKIVHGLVKGQPPRLDMVKERSLIELLGRAASAKLLRSAHDCSDGGIAVTLAECTFDAAGVGCEVDVPAAATRLDSTLFSESASRVVVSATPEQTDAVLQLAKEAGVAARVIGQTGGTRLKITVAGQSAIDCDVREAENRWSSVLEGFFQRQAS